ACVARRRSMAEPVRLRLVAGLSRHGESIECASCGRRFEDETFAVSIEDEGSAIPRDLLPHLFQSGLNTREIDRDESVASDFGSAAEAVHQLHGHLSLRSSPGRTVFRLFFPLETTDAPLEPDGSIMPSQNTILVVDDETAVASFIALVLGDAGYDVRVADSPGVALSMFADHRNEFALVITDQTMPGMTGFELAREIRMSSPGMRIVMCSGNPEDEQAGRTEGEIDAWIGKPLGRRELLMTVGMLLERS
ncbi:MAG: response regulator, partial [Pseudomonadales bacterium]|nr:response regulator [Pseudomonadales bacterium]